MHETLTDTTAASNPDEPAPNSAGLAFHAKRFWAWIAGGTDWMFGLMALIVLLAILSSLPVLNLLGLGYLLHACAQPAVSGRIRDGFVGVRKASVLGSFILGVWLVFLPIRFVSGLWKDAELIAPNTLSTRAWYLALWVLTALSVLHVIWACARGGRLRHFLWPAPVRLLQWLVGAGRASTGRVSAVEYLVELRLPKYFWKGLVGFAGAVVWLLLPVGALILASQLPPGPGALLSAVGVLTLMGVARYLPFLQIRFGMTGRFQAYFDVGAVRDDFRRAPVAGLMALTATLILPLPLYLLKIELPPREVAWLPSLLFVVLIFPARLITGWAVGRARRREEPRHRLVQWSCRLAMVPLLLTYCIFIYATQYLSWHGSLSLLEQHAFLVPAPAL